MSRYAESTSVSPEKSRAEIERDLRRYGADQFMSGWSQGGEAVIGFRFKGIMVRIRLILPDPEGEEFSRTPAGRRRRNREDQMRAWEQACRQRWRALSLVIKAKLEAVSAGITTFEDEFLAFTMLPDGSSVGQWIQPQLAKAIESGRMPKALLPGLGAGS